MMKKTINKLRSYSDRPWFVPFLSFLAFADLFVMFIPTDGLVLLASMVRPRKWWLNAILFTTTSALGALALAIIAHRYGESIAIYLLGDHFFETKNWIRMSAWIAKYGFWGISFIAIGPLPQQPAVLIAGLARMNLAEIFFAVWVGRFPKYVLYSYMGIQGPGWMKKHLGFSIDALEEEIIEVKTHPVPAETKAKNADQK